MALRTLFDKNGQSEGIFNEYEETLYYAQDVSAATSGQRLFQNGDNAQGAITNFQGAGSKLPDGHRMNIQKVGFIYRLSTGGAMTPTTLSKLVTGLFHIQVGENILKRGTLAEFFESACTLATSTYAEMDTRIFIPLMSEDGEWWENEVLNFNITLSAMETNGQLLGCLKGLYYVPKGI